MSLRTAAGRTTSLALGSTLVLAMVATGGLAATSRDKPDTATGDSTAILQRDFAAFSRALNSAFRPNRSLKKALTEARRKVRRV